MKQLNGFTFQSDFVAFSFLAETKRIDLNTCSSIGKQMNEKYALKMANNQ